MGTLGAIVGVFGFLALIAGLIMLLIPISMFQARRRLAVWLATGGFVAFAFGLIAQPKSPMSEKAPLVTASPSSTPSPASEPTEGAVDRNSQAAFIALYRELLATAKPCDQSVIALGKAANTGDQYSTYEVAKAGTEACRSASSTIGEMQAPNGLPDVGASAVKKAIETCRNAYIFRQMGMEKAMQIADGDGKPSVVSEMTEHLKTAQNGVVLCVAQLYSASEVLGVDSKQLRVPDSEG